jgi:hypothetical protein
MWHCAAPPSRESLGSALQANILSDDVPHVDIAVANIDVDMFETTLAALTKVGSQEQVTFKSLKVFLSRLSFSAVSELHTDTACQETPRVFESRDIVRTVKSVQFVSSKSKVAPRIVLGGVILLEDVTWHADWVSTSWG